MARTLDLAKKAAILTAAKSIFIKDGYAVAKMSDIAAEAGVAPGTLYLYFENKEALASAIGEELFSRLAAQLGAIISQIKDPDGVATLVDWALQMTDEDRVLIAMVKERQQDLQCKEKGSQRFAAHLAEALSGLMASGVIRKYNDPAILADLMMALMRRVVLSHTVFEDESTDELRASTITVLQHALFDDVTIAANRMLKSKRERDV